MARRRLIPRLWLCRPEREAIDNDLMGSISFVEDMRTTSMDNISFASSVRAGPAGNAGNAGDAGTAGNAGNALTRCPDQTVSCRVCTERATS